MGKIIIKSLFLLATCFQIALAQNQRGDSMGMDSTNLVPWGNIATINPNPQTLTSTYVSISGQCGPDNGKTFSTTPTNLCTSGTPSTVYTNGSSIIWSCTGNFGTPSVASCGATYQKPAPAPTPSYNGCRFVIWVADKGGWQCNGK